MQARDSDSTREEPLANMKLLNHDSAEDAKRELRGGGHVLAFSPPGSPAKWVIRADDRGFAVAESSGAWDIVDYPVSL